jgi:hypothetical protein
LKKLLKPSVVALIPGSGRWRQKDPEFKASLSYTVRPCFKKYTLKKTAEDIEGDCDDNIPKHV